MNATDKQILREKHLRDALANWRDCPLSDLIEAAEVFEDAAFLLIQRYALSIS